VSDAPSSEVQAQADDVRKRLNGAIQGIDPGSGLMRITETAMEQYGLQDYELVSTSGAAMTASLSRAIENAEWIVVTAWRPHWKFARWDLRFLEDPRTAYGRAERVHALAATGFCQRNPRVCAFIARMHIPIDDLERSVATASETSYDEAVKSYIENNPARIDYWVNDRFPEPEG